MSKRGSGPSPKSASGAFDSGNCEEAEPDISWRSQQNDDPARPLRVLHKFYVSLTRTGKAVTEAHLHANQAQAVNSGMVKKRELRHDAAIYELYHKEAQHIAKSGGTPKRVGAISARAFAADGLAAGRS